MNLKTCLSACISLAMLLGAGRAIGDGTDATGQFNNFWGNPGDLSEAANLVKTLQAAIDVYKALTATDERMSPNYEPPGAPDIPSQCMENAECKACYGDAQDKLNTTRKGLEKLRGITLYTQTMAKQGENFMSAAGGMGGTAAAVYAAAKTQDVEVSVSAFNAAVLSKRQELMGHVLTELKGISACEKTYYKNDDWYNRYGFMYYQFMISQYSNLP